MSTLDDFGESVYSCILPIRLQQQSWRSNLRSPISLLFVPKTSPPPDGQQKHLHLPPRPELLHLPARTETHGARDLSAVSVLCQCCGRHFVGAYFDWDALHARWRHFAKTLEHQWDLRQLGTVVTREARSCKVDHLVC